MWWVSGLGMRLDVVHVCLAVHSHSLVLSVSEGHPSSVGSSVRVLDIISSVIQLCVIRSLPATKGVGMLGVGMLGVRGTYMYTIMQ